MQKFWELCLPKACEQQKRKPCPDVLIRWLHLPVPTSPHSGHVAASLMTSIWQFDLSSRSPQPHIVFAVVFFWQYLRKLSESREQEGHVDQPMTISKTYSRIARRGLNES